MTADPHPPSLSELDLRAAIERAEGKFGAIAPQTLTAISELASHLRERGRLNEAERWMRHALQARRETLGEEHSDTLLSMNNLAGLLRVQGRFGESEELLVAVLAARRRAGRDVTPELLIAENNLASLWWDQGRYTDAEPLLQQVLRKRRSLLGERDPATIRAMNNLASVLRLLGRTAESERLLREAVALRTEVLGPDHKDTLSSKTNLAALLSDKEEFEEAEAILLDAFAKRKALDGADHPETLLVHNKLGALFRREGRYDDALQELSKVIEVGARLGRSHPLIRLAQLDLAMTLAAAGRRDECTNLLQIVEPEFLNWVDTEYYTNTSYASRRQVIASQETFQSLALNLAIIQSGAAATSLAATAVLHFKGLSFDEEASIARVSRESSDPEVRRLASDISSLRTRLAQLVAVEDLGVMFHEVSKELDLKEHRLALRNRSYATSLQARKCSVGQVRSVLPPSTAILEFRQYRRLDFRSGKTGEARWAGIWLDRSEFVQVRDLGAVSRTSALIDKLLKGPLPAQLRWIEDELSSELLEPLADLIEGTRTLYVAPDGALYLIPFGTLPTPGGPRLAEAVELRLILTGRDLVTPVSPQQRSGLIAMGGIDFDHIDQSGGSGPRRREAEGGTILGESSAEDADKQAGNALVKAIRAGNGRFFEGGFRKLVHSEAEVKLIGAHYHAARPNEPMPEIVLGSAANKKRLQDLAEPPRVLHLATHGFYHEAHYSLDRPLLAAGIALAGANLALHNRDDCDGLLFAIEACDLNLEGTELVVLSACETGRGQIDYGEGISGLVRALRLAGARNVLATLRPVYDFAAANFMEVFYTFLLDGSNKSPGAAFTKTQKYYLGKTSRKQYDDCWSSFILFGPD